MRKFSVFGSELRGFTLIGIKFIKKIIGRKGSDL